MKTNDYVLLSAVAAYSALFYTQNAGINFFIFSVILITLLLIRNKELINERKWLWAAFMAVFTASCVFIHSSALAVVANVISLLVLSAFSFSVKTSALFSLFFSFYTICSSIVFVIIDAISRNEKSKDDPDNAVSYKRWGLILVFMIAIVFFLLYKNSNPIFAEYTRWINLDFMTATWFFFTLGGFFLMYSFFYHRQIPFVSSWENGLSADIQHSIPPENQLKKIEAEKTCLLTLFGLLNLMLLVISFGDINTLLLGGALPTGIKHSDFVHNGVSTLILSIVLADGLIIYFLRGHLNFTKENKYIKGLIFFWILQNIFMLISTSYRNHLYITEYTLTYKRIGVYVWLFLAVIGLFITAIKVQYNKTNWYLIKTNVAVWLTALCLSSAVDWDLMITRYNLQHKPLQEVDYYYLFGMSSTNIPEMIEFCKAKIKEEKTYIVKKQSDRYYYNSSLAYINQLHWNIQDYLSTYKSDWRSFDLRDKRILKSIYSIN